MNKAFLGVAATVGLLTLPCAAVAEVCFNGLSPSNNDPTPYILNTTDVTLNYSPAFDCDVPKDDFSDIVKDDPLKTIWGDFDYLLKADSGQKASEDFGAFTFTLDWTGKVSGTFDLFVTPADKLPAWFDFVFGLKAGPEYALYYFKNFEIKRSGNDGTYKVAFLNPGNNFADLSNMFMFVRAGDGGGPPTAIPEPGSLALLGGALFGLWAVRRRKEA